MNTSPSSPGIARIALVAGVLAAIVVGALAFVVVGGDDGDDSDDASDAASQLFFEPAASEGPDPFTPSVADPDGAVVPSGDVATTAIAAAEDARVAGDTPGLYGGTGRNDACDVEALIRFLADDEEKGRAWAEVQGIEFEDLADYLRGLTPVVLTHATRVTNHGFSGGEATSRQSVLEAGTAVLVDELGVPRARCACGNPLLEPEAPTGDVEEVGEPFASEQRPPGEPVVVDPADEPVDTLVVECPSGAPSDGEGAVVPGGAAELYVGRYDAPLDRSPLQNVRNVVRVTIFSDSRIAGFASNQDYRHSGSDEELRIHVHGNGYSGAGPELSWSGLAEPNSAPFSDPPDSSDPVSVAATLDEAAGTVTGTVEHSDGTVQSFTAMRVGETEGEETAEDTVPGTPTFCVEGDGDGEPAGAEPGGEEPDVTGLAGEFTSFPGALPGDLTQNRVNLSFELAGGPVTGESVWSSTHPAGEIVHEYEWSGTFDAATNTLSGEMEVTFTNADGSVNTGTATWTGTYDPDSGVVTGSVDLDGDTLEFTASTAG